MSGYEHKACCASPPAAAWTTAETTLIGPCSSRRTASSRTSTPRWPGPPRSGASTGWTWRCWSTACTPSASRASLLTWPTATSTTAKRKFIIADTPGHEQYTRNMVTGASTSDLAIILIDARTACDPDVAPRLPASACWASRTWWSRSTRWTWWTGTREVYDAIVPEYPRVPQKLDVPDITFIPISALDGDNVTTRSANMPWYDGQTLLRHPGERARGGGPQLRGLPFPGAEVLRPDLDFRGFAGTVASGTVRAGDEVVALPSGRPPRVKSILTYDGDQDEARAGQAGHAHPRRRDRCRAGRHARAASTTCPTSATEFEAMLCWMDDEPMDPGARTSSSTPPGG